MPLKLAYAALDTDHEKLRQRFTNLHDYYQEWRLEALEAQAYVDCDYEIVRPPDTPGIIPPTAATKIETAVVELITDSPKVRKRKPGQKENEQRDADAMEAALQNCLKESEEYLQSPWLHEAAKLQMTRGSAILAGPFYNKEQGVCWLDTFDPLTVYIEPGPMPREAFIHLKMTYAELEQIADDEQFDAQRKDQSLTREVEIVRWYCVPKEKGMSGMTALWKKGDSDFLVEPKPSGYPYLPMDCVLSGWGRRTMGAKPEEMAVGLLNRGVRSVLRAEAQMFTIMDSAASQATWNRYRLPPGVELALGFKIETTPNSITRDVPEQLQPFEQVPLPRSVTQHMALLEQYIEAATFSSVLSGQRQPGVGTATGLQILTGRGRRKFYPPMRLLQAGVARMLYKVGLLAEFLESAGTPDLEWRGTKLKAEMFHDGDFSITVDLLSEDEEQRRVKIAEGASLQGSVPEQIIYEEFFGMENYSEAFRLKLRDSILNSEQFLNSVLQDFTAKAGMPPPQPKGANPEGAPPGPGAGMDRIARLYQAASGTQLPPQPGSVEAGQQVVNQPRVLPQVAG